MQKYLDLKNVKDYEKLKEPAEIIKQGGIVVFPTETVYGIGTNGLDEKAIDKLYKIKQRPYSKPISLLVSNMKMIEEVATEITDIEYKLMEAFFPGPLTIILKKKKTIPNVLTADTDTVGIRMPEEDIAQKLIEYAGTPIGAPSANITGKKSGTNIQSIMRDFGDKVDCYIDGGECKIGIGSTIVKVIDGVPNILREGSITKEKIYKVLL